MKWAKLGRVYTPNLTHPKLVSHAANPLPVWLEGDVYRVFYSGRDAQNRSSVGYVDLDVVTRQLVYVHEVPVFEFGLEGSFFSHGVSIGNFYETDGKRFILFMGWHQPADGGHWRGEIGRLVLGSDLSLSLDGTEPTMPLSEEDPISLSYPWVEALPQGGFDMWYGSTTAWDAGNGEMLHVIKHAHSLDGHKWQRRDAAIPYALGTAQAFSRPTVLRGCGDGLHMWFSYRSGDGTPYRIGMASRDNDQVWRLEIENAGIDVSPDGWDSEMIEYPYAFTHKNKSYLLYNGNEYGRTGFGLAELES